MRSLVLPQLFTAQPDGTWSPSLVEPGTDLLAADAMSASFRLRADAVWSDGTPITADDLRREFDERFVAGIDGPDSYGTVVVRFTFPLPGWRRLWSFDSAVAAPQVGVWGGPWVVETMTPGLETVLRRNDSWWGPAPNLDELRLVVVPDTTTAIQLLERGELDAVMPLPFPGRRASLERIDGVRVAATRRSGWWFGLHANPSVLDLTGRRALQSSVLRDELVSVLLAGEAALLGGLTGPEDDVWAGGGGSGRSGDAGALAAGRSSVAVLTREEEPMVGVLNRSMSKRAVAVGWRTELLAMDTDDAERRIREQDYEGAVMTMVDPPEPCWRCRWEWFDADLATAADAGDGAATRALQERLRDEAVVLPLWRASVVVAWRAEGARGVGGVGGVRANGYAITPAWNAHEWWRAP